MHKNENKLKKRFALWHTHTHIYVFLLSSFLYFFLTYVYLLKLIAIGGHLSMTHGLVAYRVFSETQTSCGDFHHSTTYFNRCYCCGGRFFCCYCQSHTHTRPPQVPNVNLLPLRMALVMIIILEMASTPYAVRNAGDVASHPKEYIYKTNTKNSEEKCWGLSRFEQWAKDKSNIVNENWTIRPIIIPFIHRKSFHLAYVVVIFIS